MLKRIYERIPLASVMYNISGNQKIRIVDFTDVQMYNWYFNNESKVPFDEAFYGEYKDAPTGFFWKYEHCEVRGIKANNDMLTIYICSAKDNYG